jgi:hypothetical protein
MERYLNIRFVNWTSKTGNRNDLYKLHFSSMSSTFHASATIAICNYLYFERWKEGLWVEAMCVILVVSHAPCITHITEIEMHFASPCQTIPHSFTHPLGPSIPHPSIYQTNKQTRTDKSTADDIRTFETIPLGFSNQRH